MQPPFNLRYLLAFLALAFIISELHEQAHITTGYLLFGCYGPRDFNVWEVCDKGTASPLAILASAAGPLFSYACMWLGAFLLRSNPKQKLFGLSLLFAAMPFARIFTSLTGGGDEKVVCHYLLADSFSMPVIKVIAAIIVLCLCLPPLVIAYRSLAPNGRRPSFIVLLLLPMFMSLFITHMFLNHVLQQGFLSASFFAGTPLLIQVYFLLMLLFVLLFRHSFNSTTVHHRKNVEVKNVKVKM